MITNEALEKLSRQYQTGVFPNIVREYFYDLYFIMRKGILSVDQKKRLAGIKDDIIAEAKRINYRGELGAFLPADQQAIIRDFPAMLERELNRQMCSL